MPFTFVSMIGVVSHISTLISMQHNQVISKYWNTEGGKANVASYNAVCVQKSASCIVAMANVLCTCNDLSCNRTEIFIFAHFPCFFRTLTASCVNFKAQIKKMVHNWRRRNVFLRCCKIWDPYFNHWMRNLLNGESYFWHVIFLDKCQIVENFQTDMGQIIHQKNRL